MKEEKKSFFYFLILDQLCKNLDIIKHPLQFVLFFSFAPIEKKTSRRKYNILLRSDSVKQNPANYRQLTVENEFIQNQWISSQQVYDNYSMQDLYFDKRISDKDTTLTAKFLHKQVCYHTNTRHISLNNGLLYALISL